MKPLHIATKKIKSAPQPLPYTKAYTLQLFGSYDLASAKQLQNKLHLEQEAVIRHTTREGKDWYVLTLGQYKTAHQADSVKDHLPDSLAGLNPWIRPTNTLDVA